MAKKKSIVFGLLFVIMLIALTGCQPGQTQTSTSAEEYTIGVAVFEPNNPEMRMFINYYRDYIEEGFPVKFIFSDSLSSAEDENDFIRSVKQEGASAIISFYGLDLESTLKVCEEENLYYVLGSGTISDDTYEKACDNSWFLGSIGPTAQAEYDAGANMTADLVSEDTSSYLVLTGGSSSGNYMHLSRSKGILEKLQEKDDFGIDNAEKVLQSSEIQTLTSKDGKHTLTLCPGYMESEEGSQNLKNVLAQNDYDTLLCAYGITDVLDEILVKETKQGSNMKIGVVDCFSAENARAFTSEDAYGNSQIDYVEGKYASMVGPAFAVAYNAITDHKEANFADGKAVRLYQGFWQATDKEQYQELYDYTQGIYENAYDCTSLMGVIKAYTEETTPEKLKELTEAYSVDDVKNRINNSNEQ